MGLILLLRKLWLIVIGLPNTSTSPNPLISINDLHSSLGPNLYSVWVVPSCSIYKASISQAHNAIAKFMTIMQLSLTLNRPIAWSYLRACCSLMTYLLLSAFQNHLSSQLLLDYLIDVHMHWVPDRLRLAD